METAVDELEGTAPQEFPDEQPPDIEADADIEAAPAKPVELPPEPPADCSALQREHYEQILAKEREVYAIEWEYLELKERAALSKKEFEAADKELRRMIARGPDQQKKLPFDKPAEVKKPKRIKLLKDVNLMLKAGHEPPFTVDADGDVSALWNDGACDVPVLLTPEEYEVIEWENGDEPQPQAAAENDAWRSAPFTELGLTFKQNELFEAQGITTIGQLEDLRARMANGDFSAQWPKGIGPAKVTEIEDRVIDWLDKNRDKFGEVIDGSFEVVPDVAPEATDETEPEHKANGKSKAKKRK